MVKSISLVSAALLTFMTINVYAEDAPALLNQLIPKLAEWGDNPIFVAAVKAHNAKKIPISEIRDKDIKWKNTIGVDDFMKELMTNDVAKKLKSLETSIPFLFECFLMGEQGANVAMTNITSDYWQGDEAKFIESFNGGKGKIHVGKVTFDDSAQAYLIQISVPVKDRGAAIGAITIGVNLDDYEISLK